MCIRDRYAFTPLVKYGGGLLSGSKPIFNFETHEAAPCKSAWKYKSPLRICFLIKESFDFANAVFGIKKTLPITNMWGTINSKVSHWNMVHTHPESILSGVFWLSTPAGSGDLVLMNPTNIDWWTEKLFAVEKIKSNSYSGTYYRVYAKEGELIIFPSYLPHMVEPNTSDVKRISISFNIG